MMGLLNSGNDGIDGIDGFAECWNSGNDEIAEFWE
jgi:hypothetical protein